MLTLTSEQWCLLHTIRGSLIRILRQWLRYGRNYIDDAASEAIATYAENVIQGKKVFPQSRDELLWELVPIAKDFLKRQVRHTNREEPSDVFDEESSAHSLDNSDGSQRMDVIIDVHYALAQLSPTLRHTAELFYLEDKSVVETAQLLECSPNTVKQRLFRARKILVQFLSGYRTENMRGGGILLIDKEARTQVVHVCDLFYAARSM